MRQETVVGTIGGYAELVPHTGSARQTRIERAIFEALRAGVTRSELRELVIEFSDYQRVRGVPADATIGTINAIGVRATPFMNPDEVAAVGDSARDRIAMMVRWCSARYYRAD